MVNDMRYKRVVFCSKDGTYRAPVAAEILRKCFDKKYLDKHIAVTGMEIAAKGMVVMFQEPVNGKAVAIGKSKGYDLTGYSASPIEKEDFSIDTLVLVMTEMDKKRVYASYENAINVYTIKEFVGAAGDIDIPFGRSLADYGENFNQLERLVEQVAKKIEELN